MNEVTMANIPCNLCDCTEVTVISRRDRSGSALRTVACRGCGLVWSDPRPHDSRWFYEEAYRLVYKQTYEPRPKHVLRAGKVALSRLEKIRPYLQGRMRILDVGSGGGEFGYLLKTLGHDVQGVEPNRGYAGYAASQYGLKVTRAFLNEAALSDGDFDLITMWHVLEHTEDPGAILCQLGRALRPHGTLVVEVPNVESICQSPRSTFHEAHIYNFNSANLGRLAAKVGLSTCASQLSSDCGNITSIFRPHPAAAMQSDQSLTLPGNHDRVVSLVRKHTRASYALSEYPYRRFAGRMARAMTERRETRTPASGRERLDALYARALQPQTQSALAGANGQRRLWPLVLCAYAAAMFMEWSLLDELLPRFGWTDFQALGLYTVLQAAAILGVVSVTSKPRTTRQYVKLAAWAGPLFGVPVIC